MSEIRRRRPTSDDSPVSRRRDRAAKPAVDEDDDVEDVDATETPVRGRRSSSSTKRKTREVEPEDVDEDEDDDEPEPPKKKRRVVEAEDDDEPAPRKKKSSTELPPGIHTGRAGAAAIRGGTSDRLKLGNEPQLFKALENDPFVSFRQHWVPGGPGEPQRPYTCPEVDCPLCEMGMNSSACIMYNVLLLSGDGEPVNKYLQLGVRADKAFEETATNKAGEIDIESDFWSVRRSGKGQDSQTNFKPVKDRDLDEEWPEIFDNFDAEELDDIIAEAQERIFSPSVVQASTVRQLREVAKHLSEGD